MDDVLVLLDSFLSIAGKADSAAAAAAAAVNGRMKKPYQIKWTTFILLCENDQRK